MLVKLLKKTNLKRVLEKIYCGIGDDGLLTMNF